MGLLSRYLDVKEYFLDDWTPTLEGLVDAEPERAEILEFNRRRRIFGWSGYVTTVFSDMFGLETSKDARHSHAALNFISGAVDDGYLDNEREREDPEVVLDETFNLFTAREPTKRKLTPLLPIAKYVAEGFGAAREGFLARIGTYKDAVVEEVKAKTWQEIEAARVKIGRTYAEVLSYTIDTYSKRQMSSEQRTAIESFSVGCTLLDDIADIFEDAQSSRGSYILARAQGGDGVLKTLYNKVREVRTNFKEGESALKTKKEKKEFKTLTRYVYTSYAVAFVRNGIRYLRSGKEEEKEEIRAAIA